MRIVKENVFEMLDHSQGAGFLQNRNKDTHRWTPTMQLIHPV